MKTSKSLLPILLGVLASLRPVASLLNALPVSAQSITADGTTPTAVTTDPSGNQISITGGTQVNSNLFHGFQQFSIHSQEAVTFYTSATTANVLSNVTGGDASVIHGRISLVGSNANLFLINPGGILFGTNASLDLPASFTATTATGIGFGTNATGVPLSWWATGTKTYDYNSFVGTPTAFHFDAGASGPIVNAGDLAVNNGQSLSLLGSSVISAGKLIAPGGEVLVMAVPGTNLVRLTQPHMILSLEVNRDDALGNGSTIKALDLPTLLTVGHEALGSQPQLTIAPDGTARISRSNFEIPNEAGVTIVSGEISTLGEVGGQVAVLGDRVALLAANLNASGTNGGGTINIGGNYQGQGNLPNSTVTLVDRDSQIQADSLSQGNGGNIVVWSDDHTIVAGNISAKGGVNGGNGGFVEVSGKKSLGLTGTVDTSAPQGSPGTLLLDPADILVIDGSGASGDGDFSTQSGNIPSSFTPTSGEPFTISETSIELLLASGNVLLEASNSITLQDLADNTLGNGAGSIGSLT
jgi:filamentous hemagglutinin family protein